jgi:hypothetical protein
VAEHMWTTTHPYTTRQIESTAQQLLPRPPDTRMEKSWERLQEEGLSSQPMFAPNPDSGGNTKLLPRPMDEFLSKRDPRMSF